MALRPRSPRYSVCWRLICVASKRVARLLWRPPYVRSLRVRALAALARTLPDDEGQIVYATAWKAAQRSTSSDVRGEALTALAISMGSPTGGSSGTDPLVV